MRLTHDAEEAATFLGAGTAEASARKTSRRKS